MSPQREARLFLGSVALAVVLLSIAAGMPRPQPGAWLVLWHIDRAFGYACATLATAMVVGWYSTPSKPGRGSQ